MSPDLICVNRACLISAFIVRVHKLTVLTKSYLLQFLLQFMTLLMHLTPDLQQTSLLDSLVSELLSPIKLHGGLVLRTSHPVDGMTCPPHAIPQLNTSVQRWKTVAFKLLCIAMCHSVTVFWECRICTGSRMWLWHPCSISCRDIRSFCSREVLARDSFCMTHDPSVVERRVQEPFWTLFLPPPPPPLQGPL